MSNTKSEEELLMVVGISGVTCGGKTTTAQNLQNKLPNVTIISQDDYFFDEHDPRHTWIPELNHVNYDIISCLDMKKMYADISNVLKSETARRVKGLQNNQKINNIQDFKHICDTLKTAKLKILIIEGFCIYNYKPLVPFFDLKYYFTLTKEECFRRRELRTYEPPDCPGYFDLCAWPEHLKQLEEVKSTVEGVNFYSGTIDVTENILRDIYTLYQNDS